MALSFTRCLVHDPTDRVSAEAKAMWMNWDAGWGGWLLMSLMMVGFWGLVIWAIVALTRGHPQQTRPSDRSDPERVLEERFARGEIDEKEFRERRRVLSADRHEAA
jgi:putative membrane protein